MQFGKGFILKKIEERQLTCSSFPLAVQQTLQYYGCASDLDWPRSADLLKLPEIILEGMVFQKSRCHRNTFFFDLLDSCKNVPFRLSAKEHRDFAAQAWVHSYATESNADEAGNLHPGVPTKTSEDEGILLYSSFDEHVGDVFERCGPIDFAWAVQFRDTYAHGGVMTHITNLHDLCPVEVEEVIPAEPDQVPETTRSVKLARVLTKTQVGIAWFKISLMMAMFPLSMAVGGAPFFLGYVLLFSGVMGSIGIKNFFEKKHVTGWVTHVFSILKFLQADVWAAHVSQHSTQILLGASAVGIVAFTVYNQLVARPKKQRKKESAVAYVVSNAESILAVGSGVAFFGTYAGAIVAPQVVSILRNTYFLQTLVQNASKRVGTKDFSSVMGFLGGQVVPETYVHLEQLLASFGSGGKMIKIRLVEKVATGMRLRRGDPEMYKQPSTFHIAVKEAAKAKSYEALNEKYAAVLTDLSWMGNWGAAWIKALHFDAKRMNLQQTFALAQLWLYCPYFVPVFQGDAEYDQEMSVPSTPISLELMKLNIANKVEFNKFVNTTVVQSFHEGILTDLNRVAGAMAPVACSLIVGVIMALVFYHLRKERKKESVEVDEEEEVEEMEKQVKDLREQVALRSKRGILQAEIQKLKGTNVPVGEVLVQKLLDVEMGEPKVLEAAVDAKVPFCPRCGGPHPSRKHSQRLKEAIRAGKKKQRGLKEVNTKFLWAEDKWVSDEEHAEYFKRYGSQEPPMSRKDRKVQLDEAGGDDRGGMGDRELAKDLQYAGPRSGVKAGIKKKKEAALATSFSIPSDLLKERLISLRTSAGKHVAQGCMIGGSFWTKWHCLDLDYQNSQLKVGDMLDRHWCVGGKQSKIKLKLTYLDRNADLAVATPQGPAPASWSIGKVKPGEAVCLGGCDAMGNFTVSSGVMNTLTTFTASTFEGFSGAAIINSQNQVVALHDGANNDISNTCLPIFGHWEAFNKAVTLNGRPSA